MDFSNFEAHAGSDPAGATTTPLPTSSSSQIMHFLDSTPAQTYTVDSDPDPSFSIAHAEDTDLDKFFARPFIIVSDTWNQSVNYYNSFDPWSAFFNDKRVVNRIANYRIVKANLHVKAVVNGNSFFYGRLLMNYLPMHTVDLVSRDRGLIPQDNIAASQRPHVYLDPTINQGGQLDLPFFYNYNATNIVTATWNQLGRVSIRTLAPLAHANGATDSVSITYFVWATEVELSVPTSYNPSSIQPQMAIDEYGSGPISKPASVLSQMAGLLKNVPGIGPYAMATQIATQALAKVAGIFGYSRPTSVAPMVDVRLSYGGAIASCNLPDTSHKLTLDCKNEITIDPRVTGLAGADEMDIRSLAMRESYLTNFPWQLSDTTSKLLFNAYVTPIQYDLYTSSSPYEVHMTPSCLVSMPFRYWRGSMKFRFQVVASSFHKGRLAIVYDPYFGQSTMTGFNTSYTYIVDIAETRDFTMTVGWGTELPYLYSTGGPVLTYPGNGSSTNFSSIGALPGPNPFRSNGVVSVFVLNDLTTPNNLITNTVQVNVFTSMADDFEVAVPNGSAVEQYSHFAYQSLVEPHSDVEDEDIAPVDSPVGIQVAKSIPETDAGNAIFFGESVRSIRQLFKRYSFLRFYSLPGPLTGQNMHTYTFPATPSFRGFTSDWNFNGETRASQIATGSSGYAYNKMTFITWFMPSFVGYRGSLRHKVLLNTTTPQAPGYLQASRAKPSASNNLITTTPSPGSYYVMSDVMPSASEGGDLQIVPAHGSVEVEVPYYCPQRFKYCRNPFWTNQNMAERLTVSFFAQGSCALMDYVAAGEDFSLQFFAGVPPMFYTGGQNMALA